MQYTVVVDALLRKLFVVEAADKEQAREQALAHMQAMYPDGGDLTASVTPHRGVNMYHER